MKTEPQEIRHLRNKLSISTDNYYDNIDYQTNESNQVTYLHLYDAEYHDFPNLNGDLSFLLEFPHLKSFEININQELDYSIIGKLHQLEELSFCAYNYIINFHDFSNLNLKSLNVEENQFSGDLDFVKNMSNLEHISININAEISLHPFQNLKKLNGILLFGGFIDDLKPIINSNLEFLGFSGCPKNLDIICNMSRLKSLSLRNGNLQSCSFIENLSSLTWLDLSSNKIEDISALQNLRELNHLILSNNQIENIEPLRSLSKLNYLSLNSNKVTDISPILEFKHLNTIYLTDNLLNELTQIPKYGYQLIIDNNPIEKISIHQNSSLQVVNARNHKIKYIEQIDFEVDSNLTVLNLKNENAGFLNRKFIKTDNFHTRLNAFESSFDDYLIRKGDYHFQRKDYDLANSYYNQIKHNPNFVKAKNIEKFLINVRDSKLSDISNDKINEIFSLVNQLKNSNYTNHYNYLKQLKEFIEQKNIPYHLKKELLSKIEGNNLNQNNEEPFINQDFKNVIYVLIFILIGIIVLIKIFSN